MPKLTVWMVRASLLYFGLGITYGGLLLINKGFPLYPVLWAWLPVHMDWLLLGWMVQLAMGVAVWIFPRFTGEQKWGNLRLAWLSFALLNSGIAINTLGVSFNLLWMGRFLELLAIGCFTVYGVRRVKPTSWRV